MHCWRRGDQTNPGTYAGLINAVYEICAGFMIQRRLQLIEPLAFIGSRARAHESYHYQLTYACTALATFFISIEYVYLLTLLLK